MNTISILQRIIVYGAFGMLTPIAGGFAFTGRIFDADILENPITYVAFIVPAIFSLFLTKKYLVRRKNIIKSGALTGAKIAFFSFILIGVFFAIGSSDHEQGFTDSFGAGYAMFIILLFFTVWAFIPLGVIAGIIVNLIDKVLYKNCTNKSINTDNLLNGQKARIE